MQEHTDFNRAADITEDDQRPLRWPSRRALLKAAGGALALGTLGKFGAATAQAAPAGTITVATPLIGSPGYIPSRMNQEAKRIAGGSFGESLLVRNNDSSLGPQLAQSWSVSEDGLALTFNLQKGIKFHDGSDFTSADVKYSLEAAARKDSTNADAAVWRNRLDRIETPSPLQVVIYLKQRDIGIPFRLAGPFYGAQVILSKTYIEKVGEDAAALNPVGTGPWKFVEFKAGELVRFEAVPNHWRQTPAFKELVIRQIPEESTRVGLVLRGEADVAQVGIANSKQLKTGGAKLFVDPNTHILLISLLGQYLPSREGFNATVPWAADPADATAWERARKVRQAMNFGIDRQAIIDTILDGQGLPAIYQFGSPGSVFLDPSWKAVPYDPAQAKKLLADAGYPNGFDFPMLLVEASAGPGAPEVGEAVAQFWQGIGLRPKLQRADYTATVRPAIGARKLAGTAFTWANSTVAEPAVGHQGGFMSTADVMFGAEYPPLDDLINKAIVTADFQQRKAIELQIGKTVIDQAFSVPIAWVNALWGASKRIKSFPRIAGVTGLYNFEFATPEA